MTITEALQTANYEEAKKLFKRPAFAIDQTEVLDQYKVSTHEVFDEQKRPKRKIKRNTGRKNEATGDDITETVLVEVVRVGEPWEKLLVNRMVGFMLSNTIEVSATFAADGTEKEKQLVALVDKIQNDNKMDYRNGEILERKLSECEVAVIWYFAPSGDSIRKFTLNSKIVSPELGDTLYPMFDNTGTMIAFRRDYKLNNGEKDITHIDVYTPEFEYKFIEDNGKWVLDAEVTGLNASGEPVKLNPIPNIAQKLLIEYHQQPAPFWADVETMIKRHETVSSNHGGMNDKFGAPLLAVSGVMNSMETDAASGVVMQMENGASAQYLNLSTEPLSIKLEQDNLKENIFMMSQMPDISFKAMQGMGTIAQFTMKAFFMDAHMACRKEERSFGLGIQRRLNIIKSAIGALIDTSLANEVKTVQLKPVFTPYLPANETELIDNLSVAKTAGIMSVETGVQLNTMITDKETELKRLQTDQINANAGLQ
jgi:SPP1 family phage portal protein